MNVATQVRDSIKEFKPGQIFDCSEITVYQINPTATLKALSRMVVADKLKKISKGLYYVPKKGILGELRPSDNDVLKTLLYKAGRRTGYVTGAALYNRMGLSTQQPKTIEVATARARQVKDFNSFRVRLVEALAPVVETDIPCLEILDVFKGIKSIPDTSSREALTLIYPRVRGLKESEVVRIQRLAAEYYPPVVRAIVGLMVESSGAKVLDDLRYSLNPSTVYNLSISLAEWPLARSWYVK
ncbi:DUF6088 family protein [Pseudomonas sp. MWU13-3659]|uniref:DUF6088 family protein n=1 Tax=Pseudomonas sp. MWU13-3659 TaxID=2986964 RepID=UPI0020752399